jgi:hypothetical protein
MFLRFINLVKEIHGCNFVHSMVVIYSRCSRHSGLVDGNLACIGRKYEISVLRPFRYKAGLI